MRTIVSVEPISRIGNDVQCKITGEHVKDSTPPLPPKTRVIELPLDEGNTIIFDLAPGQGPNLYFHPQKPFYSQKTRCPPEYPAGNENRPYLVDHAASEPTQITVRGSAVKVPLVTYYRLNFSDGSSCDPIIGSRSGSASRCRINVLLVTRSIREHPRFEEMLAATKKRLGITVDAE